MARGVVTRRGIRRRRERAAGGSIHPSATFSSPCVARTIARLSMPLARSCRLRSLAISLLRRGSRDPGFTEESVLRCHRVFFSSCPSPPSFPPSLTFFNGTSRLLNFPFHPFYPLISTLLFLFLRETFIVVFIEKFSQTNYYQR